MRKGADFHPPPFLCYVTGVISETTEKIILTDKLKVVFSVVSDSCFISNDFMKSPELYSYAGSFAK